MEFCKFSPKYSFTNCCEIQHCSDGIFIHTHAKHFQCYIETRSRKSLSFFVSVTKWWFYIAFYFVEHILCRPFSHLPHSNLLWACVFYFHTRHIYFEMQLCYSVGFFFFNSMNSLFRLFGKSAASNFKSKSLNMMFYTIMPSALLLWVLLPLSNHSLRLLENQLRNTCGSYTHIHPFGIFFLLRFLRSGH